MQLLGSKAGEAFIHVETHLLAEYADGAGTRTVAFLFAFGQYAVQQVLILFHDVALFLSERKGRGIN